MIIRNALGEDILELEHINIEAKKEQGWWIPQKSAFYKKFLRNKNNSIYLATENSKILGFISLEYNKERKSLWINDIYVIKPYRQKGIARRLVVKALENWKGKSNSIVLLAADRNLKTFERLGFKKTMNFMELAKR